MTWFAKIRISSVLAVRQEQGGYTYPFWWLYCYCAFGCNRIMEGPCVFLTLDAASYCLHGQPSFGARCCDRGSFFVLRELFRTRYANG